MLVDELADAEEELGAPRERDRAPGGEGTLRSLDGPVDLLDAGEVDLAGLDAGGRVVDGAVASRGSLYSRSVDPGADAGGPPRLLLLELLSDPGPRPPLPCPG